MGSSPPTWGQFRDAFLEQYVPRSVRESYRSQFLHLEQGSRSVSEYEAQFTRLARYAPDLIPTERARVRFFVDRLTLERQRQVDRLVDEGATLVRIIEEIRRQELFDRRAREAGDKRARH